MSLSLDELTLEELEYLANGCGPKISNLSFIAGISNFFVPKACTPACTVHDIQYWIGNTEKDRTASDKEFYGEMRRIASQQSWWNRWYYYLVAWLSYNLVTKYGDDISFYYGPRKRTLEDLKNEMNKA